MENDKLEGLEYRALISDLRLPDCRSQKIRDRVIISLRSVINYCKKRRTIFWD